MRGPASQTISGAPSVTSMQTPIHVLANELLHQRVAMGLRVSPERIQDEVVEIAGPTLRHQGMELCKESC